MIGKKFIIFMWCIFLLCGTREAFSQEILVVQNLRIKPYAEALEGFKTALNGKFRDIQYTIRDGVDAAAAIRERKPDLILAVGMEALQKVKRISHIPIVYIMVLNPSTVLNEEGNITGVGMTIAPEKQLALFHKVLPGTRRIGLLYDPKKSGLFVKRAQSAARDLRIELLSREVSHARAVPEVLKSLKGVVDALLLVPDTTVVTPETAELIMLFSLENAVPVCAFSAKYLEMGALMSLDVNAADMGRQAGGLAARILSGTKVNDLSAVDAENPIITINAAVARKLRIPLSDEVRGKARILN
jgi:putative ABC transport system substrate-binding protein